MASRLANHEHRWRIISHTVTKFGKEFKLMLGCGANFRCPAIKIVQPKKNMKHDAEFWGKVSATEHTCCATDLTQWSGEELAA